MLQTIGNIDFQLKLKKAFCMERKKITGIYWDEENLYVVSVRNIDEKWQITFATTIPLNDWLDTEDALKPAERFKMVAMKNNISDDDMVFSFPEEKVFSYEKQFPEGEKIPKMMINNDIIGTVPFSEGHFWSDFMSSKGENVFLLAAVDEEDGEAVLEEFRDAGISLSGISIELREYPCLLAGDSICWDGYNISVVSSDFEGWNHGIQTALAAALSITEIGGINLLPEKKRQNPRLWLNIEMYAVVVAFVICMSMFFTGSWQLGKADELLAEQQNQISLIKGEMEKARSWQKNRGEYKRATAILSELSEKRISWYSTMVKLSEAFTDGVYLAEVTGDESGAICINGKGVNFEAVSQYIEVLGKQTELFKGVPRLEKSEMNAQGEVSFVIKGIRLNE